MRKFLYSIKKHFRTRRSSASVSVELSKIETSSMKDKTIRDMAGIDEDLVVQLEKLGYNKLYQLLGLLLMMDQDETLFKMWMKMTCEADSAQAKFCSRYLKAWCEKNL